ncbi:MAG TPA: AtzE family amidohydrolase [Methylophilaceae bacterium]|nr:AtzE family amidohydrolase [Methylophilaceae bacterium]
MIDKTSRAIDIAEAIKAGKVSAVEVTQNALASIADLDQRYNCFTEVTPERALKEAAAIDRARQQGAHLPPLAGVPYAVKNLFDVEGFVTLAGAKINASNAPAIADAHLIKAMQKAGAVLLGALNMDEYAYGFTTENHHFGATRNPHDVSRSAGGSSGGSAAAVAAGFVPLTLGSDTNGSVRVPSSMCGIFGLKPTYGALSLEGMFPFVHSFDHAGMFARSSLDLALSFDLLQDERTHCLEQINLGIAGLRIAQAGGYFEQCDTQAQSAMALVAEALQATAVVNLPEVARARASAYVITASEGGNRHLQRLQTRAQDFDPLTRPRLAAGALVPAAWYLQAQRFRTWFHQEVMKVFEHVDVIIAPATPCSAQKIGQETMSIQGVTMPVRPNMGMFTQPISFIGLPVVAVPVQQVGGMPIGIQIIASPNREDLALRVAAYLEQSGVCAAPVVRN